MHNYWEKFDFGFTYHVYNKAIGSRKLFAQPEDFERFFTKYTQYFGNYTTLIAYCLIPNHFHFMFKIKEIHQFGFKNLISENSKAAKALETDQSQVDFFIVDQMRRWYSSTALYTNHKYQESGQLFLEKTKRDLVSSVIKFYDLICYIHHNPIHHGLAKNYEDWPYTSYNLYLKDGSKTFAPQILKELGNGNLEKGQKYFLQLHRDYRMNFDWEAYWLNKK